MSLYVRKLASRIGAVSGGIVGLSSGESARLLRSFQSRGPRPENLVRRSWSPGQPLIFDNRIAQHCAVDNYDDLPRQLNRVTVAGDVPVSVDGRRSRQLASDVSHYSRVLETAA
jgi:alpha-ketoglutarate-dependent sulfate ester dioxygenase